MPSVLWHVLTTHFTPLPIPRGAGLAAPLYFPVLLDLALPPSLPGDSNFKDPQGWHQKNKQTCLKQCSYQVPDMAMTEPAALPQENWRGEETTPGELSTTGLEEKLLLKVRQSLLFLWGYWFERSFLTPGVHCFPFSTAADWSCSWDNLFICNK